MPLKTLFESKTVWGVVIFFLSWFLNKYGYDLSEITQDALTNDVGVIAGTALAIWGRVTASAKISGVA